RTRAVTDRLLVDRDGRRQTFDVLDARLLHPPEELPGVARQALEEAPLPLLVDRVVGEARLPRAGHAGERDQRVARELEVDPLQVVLASAPDDDLSTCVAHASGPPHARGRRPARCRPLPGPRAFRPASAAVRPASYSRPGRTGRRREDASGGATTSVAALGSPVPDGGWRANRLASPRENATPAAPRGRCDAPRVEGPATRGS